MVRLSFLSHSLHRSVSRTVSTLAIVALCGLTGPLAVAAESTITLAQTLRTTPVFEEPLISTKSTSQDEDQALADAVTEYQKQVKPDDLKIFDDYLNQHPQSGWRVGLLTNIGLANYHYGYFSKAITAWEQAWREGKNSTGTDAKSLVDRAVGELARMHARLGHADRLDSLLKEIGDRPISGAATESIAGAKEGLWTMRHEPGVAYLCGPKALKNLMLFEHASIDQVKFLDDYRSSPRGVSLAEVGQLAEKAKLSYKLAFREKGQSIPVPSLVHWNVNHFAAIVSEENGRYHLKDPTFGTDLWVTRGALESESSGYFLIPSAQLSQGYREISVAEANSIRGMGYTTNNDPSATSPDDDKGHPPACNQGMCGYNFHSMVVSLNLADTPVGYAPPKGPSVYVTLTYNQREAGQPANFNFFNVSPKWTMNWLSYIEDDPAAPGASVLRYISGGGYLNYSGYNSSTGAFAAESKNAAVLTRIAGSAVTYRRTLGDGSIEVYGQSNGATAYPRRLFLTQKIDARGNAATLNYDAQLRLVSITDAVGRNTTFSYGATSNPLLITTITDPFGRSAQIAYDVSGHLQQITDVAGLTSQFTYDASSLINSMTTPYGTTQFVYGSNGTTRWLEITDPLSQTERVEFRHQAPGIPSSESQVPSGITPYNVYLEYRNTFYWDKSIYPTTHTDYTKAQLKHWLHIGLTGITSGVLESVKNPLENRIWYNYPGQSGPYAGGLNGTFDKPSLIGRVMDNGTTQLSQIAYNSFGNKTSVTDAAGRQTLYDYAPNQIDVIAVRQKTGASTYTTIAQYTYNPQHQPLTYTDANGKVTTYTYNSAGQRLTSTDALGHVTTYQYNTLGYPTKVIDANAKTVATFTYDAASRLATRADASGNLLSYQYDNLDRLTRVTYPDGTYFQYQWNKLDLASVTDRLGRVTSYTYNANRNLISVTDPANHTTQYAYFPNGTRKTTTDANGGLSQWARDIQSRATLFTDPVGAQTSYTYNGIGKLITENSADSGLKQFTYDIADNLIKKVDARGVESDYAYDSYSRLTGITYPANTTENISYLYDSTANGNNGMLRLSSTQTNDGTTSYSYDAVGNVIAKSDVLSTGTFNSQLQYDNNNRLSALTYPSGRIVTYTRNTLGQITQVSSKDNASAAAKTIVSGITYLPFGPKTSLNFGNGVNTALQYDADYRATHITTTATPQWEYRYSYDNAGNIIGAADQIGPYSAADSYDALNRVITDSVYPYPFSYQYDPNGNRTQFTIGGFQTFNFVYGASSNRLGTPYTLDASGNETINGSLSYGYSNANRLSQFSDGTSTTNYRYNGLGQRTTKVGSSATHYDYTLDSKYLDQIKLNSNNTFSEAADYIWLDGTPIAQAKTVYGANNAVTSRTLSYIHADYLNTPRAMTDSTKKVVWSWVSDAYGLLYPYVDPDGNQVNTILDLGFAGQIRDSESGLYYNINRYYEPSLGRYTQPDPIGLRGGRNRFIYVIGNPLRFIDPLGLDCSCPGATPRGQAACEAEGTRQDEAQRADEERTAGNTDGENQARDAVDTALRNYLNNLDQGLPADALPPRSSPAPLGPAAPADTPLQAPTIDVPVPTL